MSSTSAATAAQTISIPVEGATLTGDLVLPAGARGLVVFAHGAAAAARARAIGAWRPCSIAAASARCCSIC